MIRIIDYRRRAVADRAQDAARWKKPSASSRRSSKTCAREGDAALLEYARKFDGFEGASVRIPACTGSLRAGIRASRRASPTPKHSRIRARCSCRARSWSSIRTAAGWARSCGRSIPMGAYIPAGRYPLPSTLLMNVIPAQVAGVKTICVACPHPSAEILGIAAWLGVTHFFQMGGAQAIAALAYGTATVPRVDRIVGPGNIYVAAAKKLIAGETGIDFVAGPTEIVIIAAEGNPSGSPPTCWRRPSTMWTPRRFCSPPRATLANAVAEEVERQLATLPTAAVARPVHREQRRDRDRRFARARRSSFRTRLRRSTWRCTILALLGSDPERGQRCFWVRRSPEAAGDYASGPNHVLPTSGAARLRGGLSAADFVKVISVQELSPAALQPSGARDHDAGSRRRPGSARAIGRGACMADALTSARSRSRRWRRIPRPPAGARASCASISTRTPSAARRK